MMTVRGLIFAPVAVVCALVGVLALTLVPALAGTAPSKTLYFTFGSKGTLGGQFETPGGVAVNTTGTGAGVAADDVYVVDRGDNRVEQFHANGNFVRAFGLNVGGAGVNVCEVAASCVAGAASAAAGGMSAPQGVTIDQATGNVYVTDQTNRRVDVFSAGGVFEGAFGWNVKVTGAAEELQFCTVTSGCQVGTTGAKAGQFAAAVGYPAVAPSGAPDAGNILIADSTNNRIDEFSVTLASGNVTGVAFVRGIGWKVNAASPTEALQTCTTSCQAGSAGGGAGQFSSAGVKRVVVDTTGAIYALNLPTTASCNTTTARCAVQKFNATATSAADFAPAQLTPASGPRKNVAATEIAVDPTSGDVYAARPTARTAGGATYNVLRFDSSGNLLETYLSGVASELIETETVDGLAFDPVIGRLEIPTTTALQQRVFVLANIPDHSPTATTGGTAVGASPSLTKLAGSVNPTEFKVSQCYFEYGTTTEYGAVAPCVPAASSLGEGTSDIAVTAETEALEAGITYHYRLTASNSGATSTGEDDTFTTSGTPACPNASIRAEQGISSVLLPDCMALELVSPPEKTSKYARRPEVSADGNRVVFKSSAWLAESPSVSNPNGDAYVATRTPGGWVTESTFPPGGDFTDGWFESQPGALSFSPDFSSWFQMASTDTQAEQGEIRAFTGGLDGLFSSLSPLISPQAIATGPNIGTTAVEQFKLRGASADHSHLYFLGSNRQFGNQGINVSNLGNAYLPGDPEPDPTQGGADQNTYVARVDSFGEPTLELVARDRLGKVWGGECGSRLGGIGGTGIGARNQGAVSRDGSLVYFSTHPSQPAGEACNITLNKLRILKRTETEQGIQIEELFSPECTRTVPACSTVNGNDLYQGASVDGSKVFFTTNRQLVNSDLDGSATECSASTGVAGCDLYMYDQALPIGQQLIQVSAGETNLQHEAGKNADVYNGTVAISGDGSHVYFVAGGVLTEHANPAGATAVSGQPNLYLYERDEANPAGHIAYVGTLASGDQTSLWGGEGSWRNQAYSVPATASNGVGEEIGGDGHTLVFFSKASLTTNDVDGGKADIYRYDAGASPPTVECVTCRPGGADSEAAEAESTVFFATTVSGTDYAEEGRWVSEDGNTIVFNTPEGLVSGDANGTIDSYMWRDGQFYRLPATTSPEAFFASRPTVSRDGSEIALETLSPLLPQDGDSVDDVYVMRVDGGYKNPVTPPSCQAEGCQEPFSAQPSSVVAGSDMFAGPGNLSFSPPAEPKQSNPKAKVLTRVQKLAAALRACHKKSKQRRSSCEAQAKKRYRGGTKSKGVAKNKAKKSNRRGN